MTEYEFKVDKNSFLLNKVICLTGREFDYDSPPVLYKIYGENLEKNLEKVRKIVLN